MKALDTDRIDPWTREVIEPAPYQGIINTMMGVSPTQAPEGYLAQSVGKEVIMSDGKDGHMLLSLTPEAGQVVEAQESKADELPLALEREVSSALTDQPYKSHPRSPQKSFRKPASLFVDGVERISPVDGPGAGQEGASIWMPLLSARRPKESRQNQSEEASGSEAPEQQELLPQRRGDTDEEPPRQFPLRAPPSFSTPSFSTTAPIALGTVNLPPPPKAVSSVETDADGHAKCSRGGQNPAPEVAGLEDLLDCSNDETAKALEGSDGKVPGAEGRGNAPRSPAPEVAGLEVASGENNDSSAGVSKEMPQSVGPEVQQPTVEF